MNQVTHFLWVATLFGHPLCVINGTDEAQKRLEYIICVNGAVRVCTVVIGSCMLLSCRPVKNTFYDLVCVYLYLGRDGNQQAH